MDAWLHVEQLQQAIDLVWVDFGAGKRLTYFFEQVWPHVTPGGMVMVHSALTNQMTRDWLEKMRLVPRQEGMTTTTEPQQQQAVGASSAAAATSVPEAAAAARP